MRESDEKTMGTLFFVLHSPYPDGTFRGMEKCCSPIDGDGPLLFESVASAQAFLQVNPHLEANGYVPVRIELMHPRIRQTFDSDEIED